MELRLAIPTSFRKSKFLSPYLSHSPFFYPIVNIHSQYFPTHLFSSVSPLNIFLPLHNSCFFYTFPSHLFLSFPAHCFLPLSPIFRPFSRFFLPLSHFLLLLLSKLPIAIIICVQQSLGFCLSTAMIKLQSVSLSVDLFKSN